jgi:hypothetical protein
MEQNNLPTRPFGDRQLKRLYWYTTHKAQLKKASIVFFITFNMVLVGASSYLLISYYFYGTDYDKQLLELSRGYISIGRIFAPRPVNIIALHAVPTSKGYDLVARISNDNSRWILTFDYRFSYGGYQTRTETVTMFNEEEKYLFMFNESGGVSASDLQLEIFNPRWERIKNVALLSSKKANIIIDKIDFVRGIQSSGKVVDQELKFTLSNQSVYDFRTLNLNVLISENKKVKLVTTIALSNVKSQEKRDVTLSITGVTILSSRLDIKIEPNINLLDESIFIK